MGEAVTGSGSPLDLGECRHGIAQHRRVDGSSGRLLCLAVALVLSVTMAGAARATEKENCSITRLVITLSPVVRFHDCGRFLDSDFFIRNQRAKNFSSSRSPPNSDGGSYPNGPITRRHSICSWVYPGLPIRFTPLHAFRQSPEVG